MNPFTMKERVKIRNTATAVGQIHVEWQTFEKPENKRQIPPPLPHTHTLRRYACYPCLTAIHLTHVFQMSAIPRVFGQQL